MWLTTPIQYTDSLTDVAAGTYSFTVRDQHNCLKAANFTVIQPPVPFVLTATKNNVTCYAAANGEITLNSTGGKPTYSYAWSPATLPNQSSQTNLAPGNYRVTITDIGGCTATLANGVDITQPTQLEFDGNIKVDSITCPHYNDGKIDITAKGGSITAGKQYEYSINSGTDYFASNKFTGLVDGDYNVIVRDNNNCIVARKVTVGAPEELYTTALRLDTPRTTDTIVMGSTIPLKAHYFNRSGVMPTINSYLWTPSNALSCADCQYPTANPYITTKYDLELRYHKNCLAKSAITTPVFSALDFFVPSAFTPNGDGVNDAVMVYGNSIKKVLFTIFDRWGEKVFESNHLSMGWNGTYLGSPMPSGVYSYNAEVEYLNGETKNKKGSITLIK
jgi:gliding motility-associated-like protein